MENSAGPDCAAENRGWIVLNSLWTFLWKTRKTVCIHWFSGSWQTQQEQEYLQKEARRLAHERRSARRVAIGTRLLGQKGYAKLKALLKGR